MSRSGDNFNQHVGQIGVFYEYQIQRSGFFQACPEKM